MKTIQGKSISIFAGLGLTLVAGCGGSSSSSHQPKAAIVMTPSVGVSIGQQVTLDGSSSSDPLGNSLSFAWSLTIPPTSQALLSANDQTVVTFVPDVQGQYSVRLTVAAKGRQGVASQSLMVGSGLETVVIPTMTPGPGTYLTDQSVAIVCSTHGATIYYTTDGSTPTVSSLIYDNPIIVAGDGTTMTIKAMAVKSGLSDSSIASATYAIHYSQATVATPIFAPAAGSYSADQSVVITCSTAGAAIYYTVDGNTPTLSSPIYSSPILVAGDGTTMTIKAMAVKSGLVNSSIASATYAIHYGQATVATPTFAPAAGIYSADQSIVITCATADVTVHYTIDGSSPTGSSPVYINPISVAGDGTSMTIQAMASKSGMLDSAIVSGAFMISYTGVVFSQPPNPSGGIITSSWVDPNGSDSDMYAYDSFIIHSDTAVQEVRWRGGYAYGTYGLVSNFTVTFYESIAGGSQPHVTNPQLPETYLAKYDLGSNAGETYIGTIGGIEMYDYHYVLATPFQASAGMKYWIRIEAAQLTYPDWGIAIGTGGDGKYFRFSTGAAMFNIMPTGDTSFSLIRTIASSDVIGQISKY